MGYTYYQQRVRHIDVDVTEAGKFHIYTVHPGEHNTIFTAHGSEANDATPLFFVLPPIQEYANGRVYTFKGGPTSKIVIVAHYGLLTPTAGYTYCEGVTMAQFEYAYKTSDVFFTSDGPFRFITWDSSAGGVNHSITVQAHGEPKQIKGGRWLITEQTGTWNFQNSVDWSGPPYDWFESHDRFRPWGTDITYPADVAGYVNASQATTYDTVRSRTLPTTYHPGQPARRLDKNRNDYQLLWDNGQRATKRGMMISYSTFDNTAINELGKEWGANLVRYQIGPGGFPNSVADTWTVSEYKNWLYNTFLPQLDSRLPVMEEAGIQVVLDVHIPPGGFHYPVGSSYQRMRMFSEPEFQQAFYDVWDYMARKYKGDTRFWGYDLLNEASDGVVHEQGQGAGCDDWNTVKQICAELVRSIDPDIRIIINCHGGPPENFVYMTPVTGLDNITYTAHMYEPGGFTNQGLWATGANREYPAALDQGWPLRWWDKDELYDYLQILKDWQTTYNAPIYIGEFSCIRYADPEFRHRWMEDIIDIYEEYGWDWSWHAFREFDGWSVEHPEGATNSGITTYAASPTESEYLLRKYYNFNERNVDDAGSFCTNSGATSDLYFTLPPAEAGKRFWFQNLGVSGCNLRVKAYEGDLIQHYNQYATTAGDWEIYTDTPGAQVQLLATDDTNWFPVRQQSDWRSVTYSGYYKPVIHVPGPGATIPVTEYYITPAQTGTTFTCSGALSATTFYLPEAEAGLEYWFIPLSSRDGSYDVSPVPHAWPMTAQAVAGEFIRWPYTGDTYTKISSSGHSWSFCLRAYDDTGWYTNLNYGITPPAV